jgi:gamma-glutamyl hydrolase
LSDASTSHLYQRAPDGVLKTLSKEKSTSNFHHWCMTRENLTMSNLDKFYRPLATSTDDNGLEFVATIEAVNYPIWGVQFHPEKNVYEWGANLTSVPHSPGAVKAGLYFADFFVSQGNHSCTFFLHIQLIINVINCVFHQQLVRVNIGFLRDVKRRVT